MGYDVTVGGHPSTYDFTGNDPATETLVYPSSGQSLADVAKTLHVDPDALAKANPMIMYPNQALSPLQEIRVPNSLNPQMPVPYDNPAPSSTSTSSLPKQPLGVSDEASAMKARLQAASDLAGLDPSKATLHWSTAESRRQAKTATIKGLIDKAQAAGMGYADYTKIATKLASLPDSQFDRAAGLLSTALNSANPERVMRELDNLGTNTTGSKPQLIADYPITQSQGSQDPITTHMTRVDEPIRGCEPQGHHDKGSATVGSAGLADYLGKINGGRPLTNFEKKLGAGWDTRNDSPTLTPIYKIGSKEVQGYKLTSDDPGPAGHEKPLTTIYDRNGNTLAQSHHDTGFLEGEDPILQVLLAASGGGEAGIEEGTGEAVAKSASTEEAGTAAVTDGETAAGGASKVADTGTGAGVDTTAGTTTSAESKTVTGAATTQASHTLVGTGTRQQFRDAVLAKIQSDPHHPLRFLLDQTGKFKQLASRAHANLIDNPDVWEAGHIVSDKLGGQELMVQSAWENQVQGQSVERFPGAGVLEHPAVDIGGVAVSKQTAIWWEKEGLLPAGTVARAPAVH